MKNSKKTSQQKITKQNGDKKMEEIKTGADTQVDTYEFGGETYTYLAENIVVRRRSVLASTPIKDLPIGKNFAVGYG